MRTLHVVFRVKILRHFSINILWVGYFYSTTQRLFELMMPLSEPYGNGSRYIGLVIRLVIPAWLIALLLIAYRHSLQCFCCRSGRGHVEKNSCIYLIAEDFSFWSEKR